jgi:hypothetical protein
MKTISSQKMMMDNIRVAVRVRPPLQDEISQGNTFEKL